MKIEKIRDIVNNHIFNAAPSIDRMINLLSEESEREIDESKNLQHCDLITILVNAIRHLSHKT